MGELSCMTFQTTQTTEAHYNIKVRYFQVKEKSRQYQRNNLEAQSEKMKFRKCEGRQRE